MSSTRTSSPYFSPNSIIAPVFCASSMAITRACVGGVGQDLGVDERLDLRGSARRSSARCARSRSACARRSTSEPFCCTWRAQHLAQRLVHQVGGAVVAHGPARAARRRRGRRTRRRPRPRLRRCGRGGRTRSAWIFMRVFDEHARRARCAARRCRRPGRRSRHRTACGRARSPRRRRRARAAPACRRRTAR